MRKSRHRWGVRLGLPAAVIVLGTMAAGCGGGSGGGSAAKAGTDTSGMLEAPAAGAAAQDGLPATGQGRAESGGTTGPGGVNRPAVQTRAVIRKGEISLVTKEMNRARTEIDDLLGRLGGYLASEDSTNDHAGRPEHSVLVLRVPEPAFDDAMTELTHVGRTEHADRSSEDVTTQVIDVDTRVATQEASLARLQTFLRQAHDVEDMIRIESEIASRQAELESLKAQQKYLHDQTAMSTITVRLRTPAAPPPPQAHDAGFLAGLQGGWHALTTVLVGVATVAGALLPFLTLALVGVPVWLLVRAAVRRRHATASPAAPEAG